MSAIEFQSGDVIFEEGAEGTHCFKIISGLVEVRVKGVGNENWGKTIVVATCGPNEFIGEMSAFDGSARSATVVALEETVCRRYDADEFLDLLETDQNEAMAYLRLLVRRLRQNDFSISWGARAM